MKKTNKKRPYRLPFIVAENQLQLVDICLNIYKTKGGTKGGNTADVYARLKLLHSRVKMSPELEQSGFVRTVTQLRHQSKLMSHR